MAAVGPVIARMRARASRETAWTYFADPALLHTWWPDAELDVVFGGAVAECWSDELDEAGRNAVGTIDVLIAGHALGFRWRDGADEHETAVLVTLRSHEAETDIMVTETGFGRFPDAYERTADAQQSWIELLTALTAVLRDAAPDVPESSVEPEPDTGTASEESEAPEDPAAVPEALTEAAQADPDPGPAEVSEAEPDQAEPDQAEPDQAEPGEAEPDQAEPDQAEPDQAEPDPVEPDQAGPDQAEPGEAEPDPVEPDRAEPDHPDPDRTTAVSDEADPGAPDFDALLRGDAAERPE